MDHRRDRVADHRRIRRGRFREIIFVFDEFACREVGSTEQHPVDVLVAPHHALGEAGGPTGIEQVDVVGAALAEVTLGRALRQRGVELDAAVTLKCFVAAGAAIVDHQDGLHVRRVGQHIGDAIGVLALVHQRDHVRVLEQVAQLAFDVAEVDVHQDGARFHDGQHRDHDLDAVAAVQADLVVLLDALIDQVVREAVGPLLQLCVRQLVVIADQGDTVRHSVDGVLGEVGDIQGHGPQIRTCYIFRQVWRKVDTRERARHGY